MLKVMVESPSCISARGVSGWRSLHHYVDTPCYTGMGDTRFDTRSDCHVMIRIYTVTRGFIWPQTRADELASTLKQAGSPWLFKPFPAKNRKKNPSHNFLQQRPIRALVSSSVTLKCHSRHIVSARKAPLHPNPASQANRRGGFECS